MSQHYDPKTSGVLESFGRDVTPLRRANEKNDTVNKILMLTALVVCTVAGLVAGYFIGYTLSSAFLGLLVGSAVALGFCFLVYFLRKRRFLSNKGTADEREVRLAQEYKDHYQMSEHPIESEIIATSDSPLKNQKGVCWAGKDSNVRFVGADYEHDFGCYSFAEGDPIVVVPSTSDDDMVYLKLADGTSVFCRQNCLSVFDYEKGLAKDDTKLFGAAISTDGGLSVKEVEKSVPKRTDSPRDAGQKSALDSAISAIIGKGSSTL
jgi:F0F1-type ATP synthase assembly protein I